MQDDSTAQQDSSHKRRDGWAEVCRALSLAGDDEPVWSEFSNENDAKQIW